MFKTNPLQVSYLENDCVTFCFSFAERQWDLERLSLYTHENYVRFCHVSEFNPPSVSRPPLSAPLEMKEKYLICEVWEAVSHTVWCGGGRLIILEEKKISKEKRKVK